MLADDDETPAPVSNPDGSLTLASSVYNAELRSYVGNYALPYQTKCCKLTFDLNDPNHVFEYPQEPVIVPGMFITYQPCGPANTPYVLLRQPEQTLTDFNNICFNNFQLRSEVPFNVKVRLAACGAEGCANYNRQVAGNVLNNGFGVDTGIDIQVNQTLTFTATGTWNIAQSGDHDANGSGVFASTCIRGDLPAGRLLGRIGTSGQWFSVGTSATETATIAGRLYLIANDIPDPAAFDPNTGSVNVAIEVC